jgi:hypothetical protein
MRTMSSYLYTGLAELYEMEIGEFLAQFTGLMRDLDDAKKPN